jgi:hypothetical protein
VLAETYREFAPYFATDFSLGPVDVENAMSLHGVPAGAFSAGQMIDDTLARRVSAGTPDKTAT